MKLNLTKEEIKEIAENLDLGQKCYININTGELVCYPDELKHDFFDEESWEDEINKVSENFSDYEEIEELSTQDSFRIMEDFIDSIDNEKLINKLINALNRPKPFRNFKNVIDYEDEYRQKWFDFKSEWIERWVKDYIDFINEKYSE